MVHAKDQCRPMLFDLHERGRCVLVSTGPNRKGEMSIAVFLHFKTTRSRRACTVRG